MDPAAIGVMPVHQIHHTVSIYATRTESSTDRKHRLMRGEIITILGLQPSDKAAMLVVKTKEIFLLNLHQNRVHFPAERNAFVLDHQHGRRDVTCKPAITTDLLLSI